MEWECGWPFVTDTLSYFCTRSFNLVFGAYPQDAGDERPILYSQLWYVDAPGWTT